MTNIEAVVATCETKKIYLKNAFFEAPATPAVFTRTDIEPTNDIEIAVTYASLGKEMDIYDVILNVGVVSKQGDLDLYFVQVQQAGVFRIQYPDIDDRKLAIEVTCPHILLPFAREELNSLITKGGFNPFLLAPVNFMALFRDKIEAEVKQTASAKITNGAH